VGRFEFGINEGTAMLGEALKFGAPPTLMAKSGAWQEENRSRNAKLR
jgi:hypothetical protein